MRKWSRLFAFSALVLALACSQALAAELVLDFDTDPEALGVVFTGRSEWKQTGGVDDSGYLVVTDAVNSERGAIIFPDLGGGAALQQFSITADLRVGGGTASPADGFSFNFARPDDPVLDPDLPEDNPALGEGWAASPTDELNLPEEGTTTGLGIGFDEWYSGGDDVIGMSIRIDNELVEQIEFPTLNGEVDDPTSLQTGPEDVPPAFLQDDLGWARLEIDLSTDNNLRIAYKGEEVYNEVVDYEASAGLLVFGGRTGGSNAYHHIDNITVVTNEGIATALQAGDANQDLEFNQLDLVQVQISAKYLTGEAATWGQGDWNGAPGGSVGSPPAGNGLFDQVDIIAALNGDKYLKGPYAVLAPEGAGDNKASISYDPKTGEVGVIAGGTELTSINIDSAGAIFTGDAAQNLGGSFDNDADNNIFKATFGSSFGSLSFGNVAQAGLSEEFVLGDLSAVGSLLGGGDLGAVDLVYVPEPTSMILLALGIAGAFLVRRRRN